MHPARFHLRSSPEQADQYHGTYKSTFKAVWVCVPAQTRRMAAGAGSVAGRRAKAYKDTDKL
jgi:hypothetical protein